MCLRQSKGIHRYFRKQVNFYADQLAPFKPLPLDQAFPFFEWGLNWCVAQNCHQFLIIHAGVLEKNGVAIIMPGFPGAGKSTLTAALMLRGWRLLSDELTLYDWKTNSLVPIPRPVSLKNDSIDIIRQFDSNAQIGDVVKDTQKGTVAHLKVPGHSIQKAQQSVSPRFIVIPRYDREADNEVRKVPDGTTFMRMAELSFNYGILGVDGFNAMKHLMRESSCYELSYNGDLDIGVGMIDGLA